MRRGFLRWLLGPRGRQPRPRRRRIRPAGCLLWVLGLIVALLVLSLLFGGFQKGTKAGVGAGRLGPSGAQLVGGSWRVL